MSKELINVTVRPHLISFLMQELEGETQAFYEGKKVKLARITRSSLLGKMIDSFKASAGQKSSSRLHSFSMFLTITEDGEKHGLFHEKYDNKHKVLELSEEHSFILNETLESMYRISAVAFIKGYAANSTSHKFVDEAIEQFMIAHNLYNTEIDPISIRRLYYNSLKKNHSLTRIQNQISTQSLYYHTA